MVLHPWQAVPYPEHKAGMLSLVIGVRWTHRQMQLVMLFHPWLPHYTIRLIPGQPHVILGFSLNSSQEV